MFEQELGAPLFILLVGFTLGVLATLLFNKIRSGSASPTKIKQEMEDYQDKVEAHFEETSKKFKQMTTQYQDLYQHLSVGATSLCRPENIAPGLIAEADPLTQKKAIEKKPTSPQSDKTPPRASAQPNNLNAKESGIAQKSSAPAAGKNTKKSEPAKVSVANKGNGKPSVKT